MGKQGFKFKQFEVFQEHVAMKVGTDGILLGAWAHADIGERILDLGTGTGLLALMAAQRFPQSKIWAIDINAEAVNQARMNVHASPWGDRIQVQHIAVQQFSPPAKFDRMICNPPFFQNALLPEALKKQQARHTTSMDQREVLAAAEHLLNPLGKLSLILPLKEGKAFIDYAALQNWFPRRQLLVRPYLGKAFHRILLEVAREKASVEIAELCINESAGGVYTQEYCALTRDFYLYM